MKLLRNYKRTINFWVSNSSPHPPQTSETVTLGAPQTICRVIALKERQCQEAEGVEARIKQGCPTVENLSKILCQAAHLDAMDVTSTQKS